MNFNKTHPLGSFAALALVVASVTSCGSKTEVPKATQVIAKVNNEELSIHQLNHYLKGVGQVPADRLEGVKKEVLGRLVEQEAIYQEAIAKKLDRDPAIQQQLEATRRDVLVRAHLQKIAAAVTTPDATMVTKFYAEKPVLFEKRKIYNFSEITLPGRPVAWAEIEKKLLPVKSIAEAAEVLKARSIELPIAQNVQRGTEDIPFEVAEKLLTLKAGEVIIYTKPPGIVIAQIVSSKDSPVEERLAKPLIERFLTNKARGEAVQAEIKRIKDGAKVSYLGEFSDEGIATKANQTAPLAVPKDDAKAVESGVKGLK